MLTLNDRDEILLEIVESHNLARSLIRNCTDNDLEWLLIANKEIVNELYRRTKA